MSHTPRRTLAPSTPKYWGPDPLAFRPARWLTGDLAATSTASTPLPAKGETERLIEPARGTFLPWSAGPRFCPGLKMAQVEFVGVIREMFGKSRVEVVPRAGETADGARARLQGAVRDSSPMLTIQMNRPEVLLRYVKR